MKLLYTTVNYFYKEIVIMLKKKIVFILVCMMGIHNGCSVRDKSLDSKNGKKIENETQIESFETGVIVGSIIGHVSGTSVVTGTVVGAVAGFAGGDLLSKMQEKYQEKEYVLAEKISKSVENQKRLSSQAKELDQKISTLDKDTESLKINKKNQLLENKQELVSRISLKKEELLNFKELNDSAIDDILVYNNLVSYTKYSTEKKKEMENTLDSVLTNLFHLRKTCNENLEKLNTLEERF